MKEYFGLFLLVAVIALCHCNPIKEEGEVRSRRDICNWVGGVLKRVGTAGGNCGIVNIRGTRSAGIYNVGSIRAGIVNVRGGNGREKRSEKIGGLSIPVTEGGQVRERRGAGIGQVGILNAGTVNAFGGKGRTKRDNGTTSVDTLQGNNTNTEASHGRERRGAGIGQVGILNAGTVNAYGGKGRFRRDGSPAIENINHLIGTMHIS